MLWSNVIFNIFILFNSITYHFVLLFNFYSRQKQTTCLPFQKIGVENMVEEGTYNKNASMEFLLSRYQIKQHK
jgi:hypothetical protein